MEELEDGDYIIPNAPRLHIVSVNLPARGAKVTRGRIQEDERSSIRIKTSKATPCTVLYNKSLVVASTYEERRVVL